MMGNFVSHHVRERLSRHAVVNNQLLAAKLKSSSLGQILLWSIAFLSTTLWNLSGFEYVMWGGLFGVNLLRFILARWEIKKSDPLGWYILYATATLVTAISCGCISAFYIIKFDYNSEISVLVLITTAGVVAAGTAGLSPDKIVARLFVSACLLPLMVALSFFTVQPHYELAMVIALYLVFLYQQIQIQSHVILDLRDREERLRAMAFEEEESRRHKKILILEKEKAANESANIKSEFLATISHELRTPLNAIIGIGDLLDASEKDPVLSKYVKTIKHSSEALLGLVNDMLDFSEIEGDRIQIEDIPFRVADVIEGLYESAAGKARDKGLAYQEALDPKLSMCVRGDHGRIQHVLAILIDNGIKFTERGSVHLRCRLIQNAGDSALIRFEVEDTGIGMDGEAGKKLFNPFTQIDGSTSRRYGGTGLGLSICQRLVKRMGGVISFESQLGRGTKFWFELSLPIGDATAVGLVNPHSPITSSVDAKGLVVTGKEKELPSFHQERILVVEDNSTNQMLTLTMLRRLGLQCEAVPNGRMALEAWRARKFDLILMDCHMPEMDGFETTLQIRQDELKYGGHIPIVALTANVFESNRERCLKIGMDGFIAKPVRRQKLAEELKNFLPRREEAAS